MINNKVIIPLSLLLITYGPLWFGSFNVEDECVPENSIMANHRNLVVEFWPISNMIEKLGNLLKLCVVLKLVYSAKVIIDIIILSI